jgi:hypothetical protein
VTVSNAWPAPLATADLTRTELGSGSRPLATAHREKAASGATAPATDRDATLRWPHQASTAPPATVTASPS